MLFMGRGHETLQHGVISDLPIFCVATLDTDLELASEIIILLWLGID